MELRNALNAAFAIELPATTIMDYPTVEALTGHVAMVVAPSPMGLTGVLLNTWLCNATALQRKQSVLTRHAWYGHTGQIQPLHCCGVTPVWVDAMSSVNIRTSWHAQSSFQ